ncbi:MAG TPA: hypothetical protein VFP56_03945 [Candidatus Limnocylindrales bacterium]|nr:hypothetical protein [Candidatus Limnocylindrales bacterium]
MARRTASRRSRAPSSPEAKRSIAKLGALAFETLLVGHGEPIETGAAALVAELGAAG